MGRIVPLGQIPDSAVLPDGIFRVGIGELKEVMTKQAEGKTQKLMLKLNGKVVEPKAYAGQPYYDNFVIGTNDDPEAELLETWVGSIGGKQLKRFLGKTGVAFGDEEDFDGIAAAVKDVEVLATVVCKIQDKKNKDGTDNKYGGSPQNNTTGYWAIGEKEAGLNDGATSPVAALKGKVGGGTKVGSGTKAVAATKAAPTTHVSCSACNERVPRTGLKAHVDKHLAEMKDDASDAPAPGPAVDEDE